MYVCMYIYIYIYIYINDIHSTPFCVGYNIKLNYINICIKQLA